jgi:hypothetical protein
MLAISTQVACSVCLLTTLLLSIPEWLSAHYLLSLDPQLALCLQVARSLFLKGLGHTSSPLSTLNQLWAQM